MSRDRVSEKLPSTPLAIYSGLSPSPIREPYFGRLRPVSSNDPDQVLIVRLVQGFVLSPTWNKGEVAFAQFPALRLRPLLVFRACEEGTVSGSNVDDGVYITNANVNLSAYD